MQLLWVRGRTTDDELLGAGMYQTPEGVGYIAVVNLDSPEEAPRANMTLRQGNRFWNAVAVSRPHVWRPIPPRHPTKDEWHLLLHPWEKSKTEGMPELGRIVVAQGCCIDRPYGHGCTDATCSAMMPEGKTCADCIHVKTCVNIFGHKDEWTHCQWFPMRFKERAGD